MNIKKNQHPTYFIAEIGQNHQGDINIAKKMVDSLKGLPISCIKTAKRDIDVCLSDEQKAMIYDNPNSFGRTYYDHRKALELEKDEFVELKEYVEAAGFDFISSFTDKPSLDFLQEIGVSGLKIASQRTADLELLNAVADTKLPVILSTGMSSIQDVDTAVNILKNNQELYVLQCTSTYPTPEEELNLNVIPMYRDRYEGIIDGVGFSGHHAGVAPDIAAHMMGAKIIERHYTLSRSMKGTDHPGSLELSGVQYILKYLDQVEKAMGVSEKYVLESEMPALLKLRGDLK
jgi:N-acetylneuraminate synthase/sialic acid synthase